MKDDPFVYMDTNSIRAEISFLNRKFKSQKIGIIGLGGTGAYILDLIAKTPVNEIHIFDGDDFQLHNAFRAPGATNGKLLDNPKGIKKVDYYFEIYSHMHKGIVPHCQFMTKEKLSMLQGFSFVFISVDKNEVRNLIAKGLLEMNIPFIDVGLGVNKVNDHLLGTIRVTAATEAKSDHLQNRFGSIDFDDNEYKTNIQIADLNCLNASLAVVKWKKMIGFYQDLKNENNTLFLINTNKLLNEDNTA
jgi:hypothetical protein